MVENVVDVGFDQRSACCNSWVSGACKLWRWQIRQFTGSSAVKHMLTLSNMCIRYDLRSLGRTSLVLSGWIVGESSRSASWTNDFRFSLFFLCDGRFRKLFGQYSCFDGSLPWSRFSLKRNNFTLQNLLCHKYLPRHQNSSVWILKV